MQYLEAIGQFGAELLINYALASTIILGVLTVAISAHAAWKIARIGR